MISRIEEPGKEKDCKTCLGYGLWAIGNTSQPMGRLDAMDGCPTIACPECGINPNPPPKE